MTAFRLWLADLIAGDSGVVLALDEFEGLFALAQHRSPDAFLETEDGQLFALHMDSELN